MSIKIDSLIMRTINNMIAETIKSDYAGSTTDLSQKSGVKAVNLLYLYNTKYTKNKRVTKILYNSTENKRY